MQLSAIQCDLSLVPMIHGADCKTRTFPLDCRHCGRGIFFFTCECGSRVLFDELGGVWPIHDCLSKPPYGRSGGGTSYEGPSSWGSTFGINVYLAGERTRSSSRGFRSGEDSADQALTKCVRESPNRSRNTMKIEPLGREATEIVEIVRERSTRDLQKRYRLPSDSIGFQHLSKTIGDVDPMQFTVIVDELATVPAAIDLMSYSFLIPRQMAGKDVGRNVVISAVLVPVEALSGIRKWLARELQRLC